MAPATFEVEAYRFEVRRLGIDETCLGLEILGRAVGPAASALLTGSEPDYPALLQALLAQAGQLPRLLRLFSTVSKVRRPETPGLMVELPQFLDEVFGGRVDRMVAYLVHCVRAEYAYFLAGAPALAGLIPTELSASPKAAQA